jgi:hypothetical protein
MSTTDLQPGSQAFWFNEISLQNRPVTIVKVRAGRYVVQTADGHRYQALKPMVSGQPVDLLGQS